MADDVKGARLILVPQYPAGLRYQEWWYTEFPHSLSPWFSEVVLLGDGPGVQDVASSTVKGSFAPLQHAIDFELHQINEYMDMELRKGDTLLLLDISYPGFFSNVLHHKRPDYCFAFCHASARNAYDYFKETRVSKWAQERGAARLFDKVFVASEYHKRKLGWDNVVNLKALPNPPKDLYTVSSQPGIFAKPFDIISVARKSVQKRTEALEHRVLSELQRRLGREVRIHCPKARNWQQYYAALREASILLVTSKEETYGYQIVDAVLCGCFPLAPKAFSYPELLSSQHLYSNEKELVDRLEKLLKKGTIPNSKLKNGNQIVSFYENLAKEMLK